LARLGKLLTIQPLSAPSYGGGYRSMSLEAAPARANVAPEFSGPEKQTVSQAVQVTFQLR